MNDKMASTTLELGDITEQLIQLSRHTASWAETPKIQDGARLERAINATTVRVDVLGKEVADLKTLMLDIKDKMANM